MHKLLAATLMLLVGIGAYIHAVPAAAQQPCAPVLCLDGACPPEESQSCATATAPTDFEGYGAVTTGGEGGEICRVSSLADSGSGTLRSCLVERNSEGGSVVPRKIVFDVGGTITLENDIKIDTPFMTVDGSTAPSPGITIKKITPEDGEIRVATSNGTSGHDLVFTHLRFDGGWDLATQDTSNNSSTIIMDGEDHEGGVYRIVMDHMTFRHATDSSPDLWGEVNDVTISWSLWYDNFHPVTISHSGGTQARHRISMHHNVFARNNERNPQIRGNVEDFDYVNNIVYNWGRFANAGYGVRIREVGGTYPTNMNFVNNIFLSNNRPEWALLYGDNPGTENYPGSIYSAGNILPPGTDGYSTRSSPVPIPAEAAVTTDAVEDLPGKLGDVGTHYPTTEEQTLLQEIGAAVQAQIAK